MLASPLPAGAPRVSAVHYLNTVPLIWGFLRGPQHGQVDLRFASPADCAEELARGEADLGIIPVVEIARQGLGYLKGTGIACDGAVRSILLVSRKPFGQVRSLAADLNSRTSVVLARILFERRWGARPELVARPPVLEAMLEEADAALVIGDPALRLDPQRIPYACADLGAEWREVTGLPFVFALWAACARWLTPELERLFLDSWAWGRDRIGEIVQAESGPRGIDPDLARRYLTEHIHFEIGPRELEGMRLFLDWARPYL